MRLNAIQGPAARWGLFSWGRSSYLRIGETDPMPVPTFIALLAAVIAAAAATVWLISLGGAAAMASALPALLIAAFAVRLLS